MTPIGARSRRGFAAALVCLASLAALAATPPAAQATIHAVSPADGDGPNDSFTTNQASSVSPPQE